MDRPPRRERIAAVATIAAAQLLVAAAATELWAAAGFALGRPLSGAALVFGGVAALTLAVLAARELGGREAVVASALAALACAASLLLAASTFDVSWDGQAYHQSGVLAIASGWNPFGPPLPVPEPHGAPFWINHYAKGPWVRAAALFLVSGHLEVGKAWNFALAAASGLACCAALLRLPAVRAPVAVAAALLAMLNPVVTPQLFTFYVDGQLASLVTALVAAVALAIRTPGAAPLLGVASAFLLLPGVKFTGAAYAVALAAFGVASAYLAARARVRRVTLASAAGLALGAIVTGWNPYVTNLVREGHPLYPVAGQNAFDVMAGQAPRDFLARSRLAKLAIATFSASRHGNQVSPTLKWPFTWKGDETTLFQHPDARYGGFGPLFSGALVLAVLAFAAAARRAPRAVRVGGGVAAALLFTVVMNPEAWWARYAPQLWLVPLVLALAVGAAPGRTAAIGALLALAVLTADAALVAVNATHRIRRKSAEVAAQLEELSREGSPIAVRFGFGSNAERLREAGIPFSVVERLPCAAPEALAHSTTLFCRGKSP